MTPRGPHVEHLDQPSISALPAEPGFSQRHPFVVDAVVWAASVLLAAVLAIGAAGIWGATGVRAGPFDGDRVTQLRPGALVAVAVAATVLVAVRRGVLDRIRWGWLLFLAWLFATAWDLGLASARGRADLIGPFQRAGGLLSSAEGVGGHPGAFLRSSADRTLAPTVPRSSPPGPALVVATLRWCGVRNVTALVVVLISLGALVVPLVAVCTRSLCHARAGRQIVPLLVLAPWGFGSAGSAPGLAATTAAAGIACAVVGSGPDRRLAARRTCAIAAGLLLGSTALLDYPAALLGGSVVAVYFVRRRPGLIVLSALCVLVPLGIAAHWGFGWSGGLSIARHDLRTIVYPSTPLGPWLVLDLLGLLVLGGPAVITACRGVKRTPGWPFLVGAGAAVGFSLVADLARGGVAQLWLPELPWLLVPVVAPLIRPADNLDPDAPDASQAPIGLLAAGAVIALALRAALGPVY